MNREVSQGVYKCIFISTTGNKNVFCWPIAVERIAFSFLEVKQVVGGHSRWSTCSSTARFQVPFPFIFQSARLYFINFLLFFQSERASSFLFYFVCCLTKHNKLTHASSLLSRNYGKTSIQFQFRVISSAQSITLFEFLFLNHLSSVAFFIYVKISESIFPNLIS